MKNHKRYSCLLFFLLSVHFSIGQSCSVPFAINFSRITTTSVHIRWTDTNLQPVSWEIEITPRNATRTGIATHSGITTRQITIENLTPSTAYDLSIRTLCRPGQYSAWNIAIPFTTMVEIPSACGIHIPLKDNGTEVLLLDIHEEGILGKDIFIKNIDLIIDHTWPADLNISLETPQKQNIVLSAHHGTGKHHFGNPLDTTCTEVTSFSQDACLNLRQENPPFTGQFKPDTDLSSLRWDTLSQGSWRLIVHDRALRDAGVLKYFNIAFTKNPCGVPENFSILNTDVQSIEVGWESAFPCHSARLVLIQDGAGQDTVFVSCGQNHYVFDGLQPNSEYSFAISGLCLPDDISPQSCIIEGFTTCEAVSVAESFDDTPLCAGDCGSLCSIQSPVWFNVSEEGPQDWLVGQGKTGQLLTGPTGDINENGQYIYTASNPGICGSKNNTSIQSVCMDISSNASGCDMSYYYHMLGFDVESLILEISIDNGLTWEELARHEKNQGDRWYRNTISLSSYDGQSGIFRFTAVTGSGILGQIALDQIEFYNTVPATSLYTYYRDRDQDGFGSETDIIRTCQNTPPEGYSISGDDCHDDNPSIFPGAPEIPCNGIDDNCNGLADDSPDENPLTADSDVISPYCNGSADGAINLVISGGQPPYSVSWNQGSTGPVISELTEGIYYATVTDGAGCILRTPFFQLQPQNFLNAAITEVIPPSCEGRSDGLLTVSHSVENPPHTYVWSNGQTSKTISDLPSGPYAVTITDSSGCFTTVDNIDLSAQPRLQTSVLQSRSPSCSGQNNGFLEIFVSGGTLPYSLKWNTGDTTSLMTSLRAGTYTCTVTDSDNCMSIFTTELTEPEPIIPTLTNTENPRCSGESNGSIKTYTQGGTPPYTYFWNRHPVFTDDIFGLFAGDYILTVTDRNGCTAVLDTVSLKNPNIITLSIDSLSATTCQAGATGYISVSAEGGNGGYNYIWQNTDKNSPFIDSLVTGHYSLTVFDKLGCKQSIPQIFVPFVNQPVDIQLTLEKDNVCFNEKQGVIRSHILSGQSPFDYNWSQGLQYFNPSLTDTLSGLPRGTYKLTVTDAEGCVGVSNDIFVSEGLPVSYEITHLTSTTCRDSLNGEIRIQVTGGQPPYNILWNDGAYSGTLLRMLPAGTYSGIITDSLGCTSNINTLQLEALSDIRLNPEIIHISDDGQGQICIQPEGGIFPYHIRWSTGTLDDFCIGDLSEGTYRVTVTDNLSCQVEREFLIEKSTSSPETSEHLFRIYPQPVTDVLYVNNPYHSGLIHMTELTGSVISTVDMAHGQNVYDVSFLPAGMYILKIEVEHIVYNVRIVKI